MEMCFLLFKPLIQWTDWYDLNGMKPRGGKKQAGMQQLPKAQAQTILMH